MKARNFLPILILGLLLLITVAIAYAQAESAIPRWLIGGGGGRASSGNVSITGALGQPISGAVSSGGVTICSGFWCGGPKVIFTSVYLPSILKEIDPYAPPCSPSNHNCEENDTRNTAYGPLGPGREYTAYPDDANDYYYIELAAQGSVDCRVTGYQADGQLIVYNAADQVVGSDYNYPGDDGIMQVTASNLPPGKYYIRIYTGGGFNTSSLYTLRVNY